MDPDGPKRRTRRRRPTSGELLPMNVKRLTPISLAPEIDWTR